MTVFRSAVAGNPVDNIIVASLEPAVDEENEN